MDEYVRNNRDLIFNSGLSINPTFQNKDKTCGEMCLHYTLFHAGSELDQFKEGLKTLGVLDLMKKHPKHFIKAFQAPPKLSAEFIDKFYRVLFTNTSEFTRKEKEELIIKNWRRFLCDVEKGILIAIHFNY